MLAHFDVAESRGIVQSGVAVVVLNVGVQLVLFEQHRRELVVTPVCGLVQRASSAAAFKSVHVGFGSKATDLIKIVTTRCNGSHDNAHMWTCSNDPCMAHSLNSALAWSREARGDTAELLQE